MRSSSRLRVRYDDYLFGVFVEEVAGVGGGDAGAGDLVGGEDGESLDDADRMVILERWTSQELLEQHMAAERTRNAAPVEALVALWAPGSTPTVERFES